MPTPADLDRCRDFLSFVNAGPSPFHVVHESCRRLTEAGFTQIWESESWTSTDGKASGGKARQLKRGGKYFFTRNQSTLVAFVVGGKYEAGNGVAMIGAHTDSPCLKIKPVSKKEANGCLQVSVEPYGGGLWHTWFDRDLSIAGRVTVRRENGKIEHPLVRIERPILRIPCLAIHLDPSVRDGFKFNKQDHLLPIIATSAAKALGGVQDENKASDDDGGQVAGVPVATQRHHPVLIEALAKELNVGPDSVEHLEICLYDTQPACFGGLFEEYVFGARFDNLGMSYCSLLSLIETSDSLADASHITMVTLYDNEEVGSRSMMGADSALLQSTLDRLVCAFNSDPRTHDPDAVARTIHNSFVISADMAHAIHPNYCKKHEENHSIYMNKGLVIKYNSNMRYASNAPTAALLKECAVRAGSPLQEFVVRNDSPCGSTIGPIISAKVGVRCIGMWLALLLVSGQVLMTAPIRFHRCW